MSDKKNISLNSSFDIIGKKNNYVMNAFVSIVQKPISFESQIVGSKSPLQITTGKVLKQNEYNPFDSYVSNAKITALKNGVVVDYDITREDGLYFLYLESGLYDIRIESQSYNRVIKNFQIRNGIQPYRTDFKSGRIKNVIHDSVYFNGLKDKRLVVNQILDQHGKPVEGAEIIVVLSKGGGDVVETRDLVAFVKTDSNGSFSFIVNEVGPYDVIIRGEKYHAKVIKKHKLIFGRGFFQDIILDNLSFSKKPWIVIDDLLEDDESKDIESPTMPTNLSASNITTNSVTLSWDFSTDNVSVDSYEVYQNSIFKGKTNDLTFLVSGLTPSTNYTFVVKAKDVNGNRSSSSNLVSIKTLSNVVDRIPPTTPSNIRFTNDIDPSDNEWELDWEDASDESGIARYEVFADDILLGSTQNSHFDFNGSLPTYYNSYFSIKTFDLYGNYSYTNKKKLNT